MMRKTVVFGFLCFFTATAAVSGAEVPDSTSLTRVGEMAPAFTVTTTDGLQLDLEEERGRVILVNFFATWCPPCIAEMPRLEKEIWQDYKGKDFIVIAVGREHTLDEIKKFQEEKSFTFPLAPDPDRGVYAKYATKFIPRNVLIDKKGRIVYQSKGYTEEEFDTLLKAIENALK